MDNTVTLKFLRVDKAYGHGIAFEQALGLAINLGDLHDREKNINAGFVDPIIVRLERLVPSNGFVSGELIRKQISNIPPEANDDGLSPIQLSDGGGLGLSSAFRYHIPTRVLLIQANNQAVSSNRLNSYLKCVDQNAEFTFASIPRSDAWGRFNNGLPRRLLMKIASPDHVPDMPNAAASAVGTGVANIGEALRGAYITIEVSMGRKQGSLLKGATEQVLRTFARLGRQGDVEVKMLSASVSDGEGTDLIDFLDEYLIARDRLDLPERNPEGNYQIRANFLISEFQKHLPYIHGLYGQ